MSLGLSGINSGIDSDLIIQKMLAVSSRPLVQLQRRKVSWQSKDSALGQIESLLGSIQSHAAGMDTEAELRQVKASSSSTSITVSAEATATEGTHDIVINQLAKAEREVQTTGVDALTTVVYGGVDDKTFTYTYNGTQRTVTLEEDATFSDLMDMINNDDANPGVEASALSYNGKVHLVLSGADSGSSATITVDQTLVAIGGFTETQTAQSAEIKVDGFPVGAEDWIERDSNTITDVLPGVTLNLHTVDADPVIVTLTRDVGGVKNDVQNLVNMYISLFAKINDLSGYDEDAEVSGPLQGDSTARSIKTMMRGALLDAPLGFAEGEDPYILPAELGIKFDEDGELIFDTSIFNEAMSSDYEGVLSLLGADKTGISDDDYLQFYSATGDTAAGEYEVEVRFSDATGNIIGAKIKAPGSSTWNSDVTISGNQIIGNSEYAESGLVFTATQDPAVEPDEFGIVTQTANIRVRQGLAGRITDKLEDILDSETGMLTTKQGYITDQIEKIDDSMEEWADRLDREEERLRAQYARLEATLARMQSQQGAFQALIQQLSWNQQTIRNR
jgi:flagellar hook-associated protein 2